MVTTDGDAETVCDAETVADAVPEAHPEAAALAVTQMLGDRVNVPVPLTVCELVPQFDDDAVGGAFVPVDDAPAMLAVPEIDAELQTVNELVMEPDPVDDCDTVTEGDAVDDGVTLPSMVIVIETVGETVLVPSKLELVVVVPDTEGELEEDATEVDEDVEDAHGDEDGDIVVVELNEGLPDFAPEDDGEELIDTVLVIETEVVCVDEPMTDDGLGETDVVAAADRVMIVAVTEMVNVGDAVLEPDAAVEALTRVDAVKAASVCDTAAVGLCVAERERLGDDELDCDGVQVTSPDVVTVNVSYALGDDETESDPELRTEKLVKADADELAVDDGEPELLRDTPSLTDDDGDTEGVVVPERDGVMEPLTVKLDSAVCDAETLIEIVPVVENVRVGLVDTDVDIRALSVARVAVICAEVVAHVDTVLDKELVIDEVNVGVGDDGTEAVIAIEGDLESETLLHPLTVYVALAEKLGDWVGETVCVAGTESVRVTVGQPDDVDDTTSVVDGFEDALVEPELDESTDAEDVGEKETLPDGDPLPVGVTDGDAVREPECEDETDAVVDALTEGDRESEFDRVCVTHTVIVPVTVTELLELGVNDREYVEVAERDGDTVDDIDRVGERERDGETLDVVDGVAAVEPVTATVPVDDPR